MTDPVQQICDECKVCRERGLYYLEGCQWDLNSAMEACRKDAFPSLSVKSSRRVSVNKKSEAVPFNPLRMVNTSLRISDQTPNLPERQPSLKIMPERQPPLHITPDQQPRQSKDELINSFCMVALGTHQEDAVAFLSRCNWDVDAAVGLFMDQRRPTPGKSQKDPRDVPLMLDWSYLQKLVEVSAHEQPLKDPSRFHNVPIKLGNSSSSSMNVDPTKTEKSVKVAGEGYTPLMASSQVNAQDISNSHAPPMSAWVDIICHETQVCREEALYYLEGYKWNFEAALEACDSKILPPIVEPSQAQLDSLKQQSQLHNQLISSFCEAAPGATREVAIAYLKVCNWDIHQALGFVLDGLSLEETTVALGLTETRDLAVPSAEQSSQFNGGREKYLEESKIGRPSSSVEEAGEEDVTDMAVEEVASKETFADPIAIQDKIIVGPRAALTTITVKVYLADGGSGTPVDFYLRSNQTVRDIRNAIDERTPYGDRNYYLLSELGEECRDLNMTVHRISSDGTATLHQIFEN